ncbi:MAG: hypothetical protein JNL74_01325 [Fibrobacteres bacterium]|nr:hypothetical protein [Fibrobacterota bacterium]
MEQVVGSIPVRKPNKQEFHRVADWSLNVLLLEHEGESYAVVPGLHGAVGEDAVLKRLHPTASRGGGYLLWAIKTPDEEGKLDDWNRSALRAAEQAKTKWTRVRPVRAIGAYRADVATAAIPEPVWPDLTPEQWLEIAFQGRIIDSVNHPVLLRLRGEI